MEGADTNLSLRKRIQEDVNRVLPGFDEPDDHGIGSVEAYFQNVSKTVEGLKSWNVRRWLTLGHFSFGQLAECTPILIPKIGLCTQRAITLSAQFLVARKLKVTGAECSHRPKTISSMIQK